MAARSSVPAWRIPWAEEPQVVGHSPWDRIESDTTEAAGRACKAELVRPESGPISLAVCCFALFSVPDLSWLCRILMALVPRVDQVEGTMQIHHHSH